MNLELHDDDLLQPMAIPASARPTYFVHPLLFYRHCFRLTSTNDRVARVIVMSERFVVYLCAPDGRATWSFHPDGIKSIHILPSRDQFLLRFLHQPTDLLLFFDDKISGGRLNPTHATVRRFLMLIRRHNPSVPVLQERASSSAELLMASKLIKNAQAKGVAGFVHRLVDGLKDHYAALCKALAQMREVGYGEPGGDEVEWQPLQPEGDTHDAFEDARLVEGDSGDSNDDDNEKSTADSSAPTIVPKGTTLGQALVVQRQRGGASVIDPETVFDAMNQHESGTGSSASPRSSWLEWGLTRRIGGQLWFPGVSILYFRRNVELRCFVVPSRKKGDAADVIANPLGALGISARPIDPSGHWIQKKRAKSSDAAALLEESYDFRGDLFIDCRGVVYLYGTPCSRVQPPSEIHTANETITTDPLFSWHVVTILRLATEHVSAYEMRSHIAARGTALGDIQQQRGTASQLSKWAAAPQSPLTAHHLHLGSLTLVMAVPAAVVATHANEAEHHLCVHGRRIGTSAGTSSAASLRFETTQAIMRCLEMETRAVLSASTTGGPWYLRPLDDGDQGQRESINESASGGGATSFRVVVHLRLSADSAHATAAQLSHPPTPMELDVTDLPSLEQLVNRFRVETSPLDDVAPLQPRQAGQQRSALIAALRRREGCRIHPKRSVLVSRQERVQVAEAVKEHMDHLATSTQVAPPTVSALLLHAANPNPADTALIDHVHDSLDAVSRDDPTLVMKRRQRLEAIISGRLFEETPPSSRRLQSLVETICAAGNAVDVVHASRGVVADEWMEGLLVAAGGHPPASIRRASFKCGIWDDEAPPSSDEEDRLQLVNALLHP